MNWVVELLVDRSEMFTWGKLDTSTIKSNTNVKDRLLIFKNSVLTSQLKINMLFGAVAFMLGRAIILGYLNPFSMAFLAVSSIQEMNIFVIMAGLLLGVITTGSKEVLLKFLISSIAFILLYFATKRFRINKKILVTVIAMITTFGTGYLVFYIKDYFLYDLLMQGAESVMCVALILIYDRAFPVIKKYKSRHIVSTEELIAICIMFAFCFVGTEVVIAGLSVRNIIVIFVVMTFAYYGNVGMGASVGMILGLIQSLAGEILPAAIGVYGLCGLLCNGFKTLGKFGCPLGFIIGNALMTYYINGSTEVLIKFYEILIASAVFMLMPKTITNRIQSYKTVFAAEYLKDRTYNLRIKQYTSEKLREVSGVFDELAVTLKESIQNKDYFSQDDAAQIIEAVVDRACEGCGMKNTCWKRDFYKSYQNLFSILSEIETGNDIVFKELNPIFKNRCIKPEEVFETLKFKYELYRNNLNWEKKINESRDAVSGQFKEISAVVSNLASRIDTNVDFNRDIEEQIMVALDDGGIMPDDVIVAQSSGNLEVEIKVSNCGGRRKCMKEILPMVDKATGKKFVKMDGVCNIKVDGSCSIKFKEAYKYQIAGGVARAYKSKDKVSGDNYSFIELKNGKYMLALSDGMGTGAKAAVESNTTISLLEKFLCAGFDKDIAIRTINSLILLKSNEESYATVDMAVINQYNAEVEFVKVGAVSTFVKSGNRVEIIRTSTLPVGILSSVEADIESRKLKNGDFIVMVTDGILDANKDELNKEKWLANMIEDIETRNPQAIADTILINCLDYTSGVPNDDMTVMVAKIWETMN